MQDAAAPDIPGFDSQALLEAPLSVFELFADSLVSMKILF